MGAQSMITVLKMSEFSHHLADDHQKIDGVFSTLWLEKPPLGFSNTATDLQFTSNY